MSVNGDEVGIHLVAFEMKEKVVYEALLVPVYMMLDRVFRCIAVLTYAELVNTTTIDSELHLNKSHLLALHNLCTNVPSTYKHVCMECIHFKIGVLDFQLVA